MSSNFRLHNKTTFDQQPSTIINWRTQHAVACHELNESDITENIGFGIETGTVILVMLAR